jgi:asparagine synthetase B (glutamine-hydrolysing)
MRKLIVYSCISDVPLGVFLSGGVDSSTIAAHMQEQSATPNRTFTIGFDEPGFDEAPYARAVADHLGTDHTEMRVTAQMAQDVIKQLPRMYDEPFAGLDPISLGITARLIRSLSDKLGCASVVITHDIVESFAIADHVYLVGQGVIKAHGTPKTLGNSTDPYVQQFLKGEADGPVPFDYPSTPKFEAWLVSQEAKR